MKSYEKTKMLPLLYGVEIILLSASKVKGGTSAAALPFRNEGPSGYYINHSDAIVGLFLSRSDLVMSFF